LLEDGVTIDFGAAQYEVGEGFPSIEGWHLDPHLELSFWDSSLHFQRGDKETRQLERLHVVLFEGRLRSADVDLCPLYDRHRSPFRASSAVNSPKRRIGVERS
jgi:hypothetical protein